MYRYVLHCDLDAFYAAVEQRDNPEYRGKPLIVGGRPGYRGVVSTCSYEARSYGVRSAMPISTAQRLCPAGIFVEPDMAKYRKESRRFFGILNSSTPHVEAVSIDEAYLEVVGPHGIGVREAQVIRKAVREKMGITVSVGVGPNKLLARVAAAMAKPNGIMEIPLERAGETLWPLDIGMLPGIGEKTQKHLKSMGIKKIEDLAKMPDAFFRTQFGSRWQVMRGFCEGTDPRPVEISRERKSMSEETTFPEDVSDARLVLGTLLRMAEDLGYRLRVTGYLARTVTLKLRYEDFETLNRGTTLSRPTSDEGVIYLAVEGLFKKHVGPKRLRLVGIQVSSLLPAGGYVQQDFFPDRESARARVLSSALDDLRRKYGRDVIRRAGGHKGVWMKQE